MVEETEAHLRKVEHYKIICLMTKVTYKLKFTAHKLKRTEFFGS